MSKHRSLPFRGVTLAACAVAGLLACNESRTTGPTEPTVLAAKGGVAATKVKVNEAIPSEAPQETRLDVVVIGSGFDDGSVVKFLLAGQSTPKVVVNSSTYEPTNGNLVADLTVAVDADVALYDIEVTTSRGKKGIGTEMFLVQDKDKPVDIPVTATFRDALGDGVLSDGGGSYDAVILAIGNLMLDARVDIPRQLCLDFAAQAGAPYDEVVCDDAYLTTADPDVPGGLPEMGEGDSMTTRAQVTWVGKDSTGKGYNWFLQFGQDCESVDVSADRLTVTHHLTLDEWVLEGDTATLCRMPTKGRPKVQLVGEFSMPFSLTVAPRRD